MSSESRPRKSRRKRRTRKLLFLDLTLSPSRSRESLPAEVWRSGIVDFFGGGGLLDLLQLCCCSQLLRRTVTNRLPDVCSELVLTVEALQGNCRHRAEGRYSFRRATGSRSLLGDRLGRILQLRSVAPHVQTLDLGSLEAADLKAAAPVLAALPHLRCLRYPLKGWGDPNEIRRFKAAFPADSVALVSEWH